MCHIDGQAREKDIGLFNTKIFEIFEKVMTSKGKWRNKNIL